MLFDASKYARFISHLLEIYISLLKKQKQINPSGPFSQRPEISDSTKKLVYCNISKSTVPHNGILLIEVTNTHLDAEIRNLCQIITGEKYPVSPRKNEIIMLSVYYHIFIVSIQGISRHTRNDLEIPLEIQDFITKIENLKILQSLRTIKLSTPQDFSQLSQLIPKAAQNNLINPPKEEGEEEEEEKEPTHIDDRMMDISRTSRTEQWREYIDNRISKSKSSVYLLEILLVLYECIYKEYVNSFHIFMLHVFRKGNFHRFVFGKECVLGDSAKFALSNWVESQLINTPKSFTDSINYIASICQQVHEKCPKTSKYDLKLVNNALTAFSEWMNNPEDEFCNLVSVKLPVMLHASGQLSHFSTVEQALDSYSSGNDSWEMFRIKTVPLKNYVSGCSPAKFAEIEACLWSIGTVIEMNEYSVVKIICHASSKNLYDTDFSLYSILSDCGVEDIDHKFYVISPQKFVVLSEFIPTLQYLSMCCALRTDTVSTSEVLCTPYLCQFIKEHFIKSVTHIDVCVPGESIDEFSSSTMKIDRPISSPFSEWCAEIKLRALFEVLCSSVCFKYKSKVNHYLPELHSELHVWAGIICASLSCEGSNDHNIIFRLVSEAFSANHSNKNPTTAAANTGPVSIFNEWEKVLFIREPHVFSLKFDKENTIMSRKILKQIPKDLAICLLKCYLSQRTQPIHNGFSDCNHLYEHLTSSKAPTHLESLHICVPLEFDQLVCLLCLVLENARKAMIRPKSTITSLFRSIKMQHTKVGFYKRTRSKSMDMVMLHHTAPANSNHFVPFSREYFVCKPGISGETKPRHSITTRTTTHVKSQGSHVSPFQPMSASQLEQMKELSSIAPEQLRFHNQSQYPTTKPVDCALTCNELEQNHILEYYRRFFVTLLCLEYSRTLRNKEEFAKHIPKLQRVRVFGQNMQGKPDLVVHRDLNQQTQIRGHEFLFMLNLKISFPMSQPAHNPPVHRSKLDEMFEFKTGRAGSRVTTVKLKESQTPKNPLHINNVFSHLIKYSSSIATSVNNYHAKKELASIVTVTEYLRRINNPNDSNVPLIHHHNQFGNTRSLHLCAPLLRGLSAERDITFCMALGNLLTAYLEQLDRLGNSRITSSLTILAHEATEYDTVFRQYTRDRLREFARIVSEKKARNPKPAMASTFSVDRIKEVLEFPCKWIQRSNEIMNNASQVEPTILGKLVHVPLLNDANVFDATYQLIPAQK